MTAPSRPQEPAGLGPLRCSTVARELGLDPLGTAGSYAGFLLVEWPLPWPEDLGEVAAFRPLVEALDGSGIRLQGLVPAKDPPDDGRRVALYLPPDGDGFRGYARHERRVPPGEVVPTAVDLVRRAGSPAAEHDDAPGKGDILICTHGRRDACCGRKGIALVNDLGSGAFDGTTYRVSRTSHTGGHRFAPTGIVLPEGTLWAFLDSDLVGRIARRDGPLDDALAHYRGCSGLPSPAVQAVERAAFAEVGWGWLDWRRSGAEIDPGRVRLVGEGPDGTRRTWTATVETRARPVPLCGAPLDEAVKQQLEPVVTSLERS